jgi:L-lactate transport
LDHAHPLAIIDVARIRARCFVGSIRHVTATQATKGNLTVQWMQNYSALGGSLGATALAVAIPIVYLFWALAIQRMKGHVAGSTALLVTIVVTVTVYGMPVSAALAAAALGVVSGLFPIGWIILSAVFLYNLMVESGQFEIFKSSISTISNDRRLQALLVAFCFSAFMEGSAGQGAPVVVAAAMLMGLGFPAMPAALICLVGNTPPVPYGPVGVPTIMMGTVTGVPPAVVSGAIGIDMAILALVIPTFMVVVLAGWRNLMEVLPAAIVAGVSYAIPSFLISRNLGPELPAVVSSAVSMLCLFLFLKVWQPRTIWRFAGESAAEAKAVSPYTSAQVFRAWTPYIILIVMMVIWGLPAFKAWVANGLKWYALFPAWPFLDGVVYQVAPVVAAPFKYNASYRMDFLSTPGTAMFLSAVLSMPLIGVGPARAARVFARTFCQLYRALITLASVIGIGFLANYSGMSFTLGLAFAHYTGVLFPVFSPMIGYIGVFLTGSVTSSAALFGKLQQVTAGQLGLNPLLTISASMFGSVIGKLISPQSIAVACAGTNMVGNESAIFRRTSRYSLVLLAFVVVLVLLEAWVFPGIWG